MNRYPRVRRVAAEQLYVTLLGMDGDEYGGDAEAAAELLSDTRWDAELAVVKPARNELYPLLGLVAPANATAAPKGKASPPRRRTRTNRTPRWSEAPGIETVV